MSWKDLFDIAGTPTTCGSRLTSPDVCTEDAEAVKRITASGAVCVGKTNLSEFAFSGLGMNPHYGTPRNPSLPMGDERVCGGSSSGAAASVVLGLCELAIGTDTSGSVRVPASFTGLLGFRASSLRYPKLGLWTLSPTLDAIGFLAHRIDLIAAADAALTLSRAQNGNVEHEAPLFVVDCGAPPGIDIDAAVVNNLARFSDRLQHAGYEVKWARHIHTLKVQDAFTQHGTLVAHEALETLSEWLAPASSERLDPRIFERLQQSRDTLLHGAAPLLRQARTELMTGLAASVPRRTVFVSVTTPTTAPRLQETQNAEDFDAINQRALSMTMPGSFLDMPSLAVPSGIDANGAPTSVMLSVLQGYDSFLLRLAGDLECDGLLACATAP